MLFNSYAFLAFFLVVLAFYQGFSSWTWRRIVLLLSSYVFYATWNPPFVLLLWFSTVVDWYAGRKLFGANSLRDRKLYLAISMFANLGLLAYFKYGGFFVDNWNSLSESLGFHNQFSHPSIILPVGISFYTFQTLSYTFDIYKGRLKPADSFLNYALYVTFFPQLVAGPIVRAVDFLPQCEEPKGITARQLGWGLSLLAIGLFTKVVVADELMAPIADKVYDFEGTVGFLSAWTGTLAFAIQIFCDFAGYSTCAIGVALCLGFSLPDNFRFPYAAVGFSDFWRRWHISLSTWLRDYLYISLGGSRHGPIRTYVSLSLTMLLGGLWHGASWMFVIWGALHGFYLIVERLLLLMPIARHRLWQSTTGRVFLQVFTFWLVCITWVFFRAQSLTQAWNLVRAMIAPPGSPIHEIRDLFAVSASAHAGLWLWKMDYILVAVCTVSILVIHSALKHSSLEELFVRLSLPVRSFALSAMIYLTLISMAGVDRAFIYFQF